MDYDRNNFPKGKLFLLYSGNNARCQGIPIRGPLSLGPSYSGAKLKLHAARSFIVKHRCCGVPKSGTPAALAYEKAGFLFRPDIFQKIGKD